ncbi:beta-galactosidase 6 isoform X1 [Carex littledalei]|uniref:Beta-galactosidase n=1 Tax=Carex littledalei TaxID=544730 RepID=A0A833QWF5_9POAL|nr:beta-galactosidase 6 isoform X1 [Carex littledalei]
MKRCHHLCSLLPLWFSLVILFLNSHISNGDNVTYDHRALVINGVRRVLISGSIHYPRSTPEMWPDLIQKAKDGGLDIVETYIFWNLHEPVRGQYEFEGRKDLVKFVKTIAAAGLYVHLRIGPYACAEWNYGGFPVWLHFIPGIKFRTDNEPFKTEMQRFTAKIVDLMKQENLYASQGGPIILSQIENEYGNIDAAYGSAAQRYIKWAASMAVSLDTGVPWVMCQQSDAPDPIINTCNGFYCDQFSPNSNNKPKMWTENWPGWFLSFGGAVPYRPVQDIAFAVARFFQRGGTFQNYYMYHGGTNFGRTTGGPFVATSYDYDAPIDEYGLLNQPKWGHLRDLHKVIKKCEPALVATDPAYTSLGQNLEAHVYKTSSGACAAFLANINTQDATVKFNGNTYQLPGWSVSILPDCKNVAYNTAQINSQETTSEMRYLSSISEGTEQPLSKLSSSGWSYVKEPIGISKADAFTRNGLVEQINTTADASDYLWYSISVNIRGDEPYLVSGAQTLLHVESLGHVLRAFVNGRLVGGRTGSASNVKVSLSQLIILDRGKNTIDLLSATVGLQNYGAFFDLWGAGVTGPVTLSANGVTLDLSSYQWTYQIGLKGEDLSLFVNSDDSDSLWVSDSTLPMNEPLVWYKTQFEAPAGNNPVAIDFTGMGKGEAWINGQSIGRFWPTYTAPSDGCSSSCSYKGAYSSSKCLKNCGKPSQQLYHVPRSFLQEGANTMVLFEEIGGDPTKISFATKKTGSLCAHVSEMHPPQVNSVAYPEMTVSIQKPGPLVHLTCPGPDQIINEIKFASFGNPQGTCGSYSHGECSSTDALTVVEQACVGTNSCSVAVSIKAFGDPCKGVTKSLAIEATCSS